jgi:hypothetical protein
LSNEHFSDNPIAFLMFAQDEAETNYFSRSSHEQFVSLEPLRIAHPHALVCFGE